MLIVMVTVLPNNYKVIYFSRANTDNNGELVELGKTRRKRHRRKPVAIEVKWLLIEK